MLGEADAKFPGQTSGAKGPEPTRENPAGVYPKADPIPAPPPEHFEPPADPRHENPKRTPIPKGGQGSALSPAHTAENPYLFEEKMSALQNALEDLISLFEAEGRMVTQDGRFHVGQQTLDKFRSWRDECRAMH